jgi:hypothetical protein
MSGIPYPTTTNTAYATSGYQGTSGNDLIYVASGTANAAIYGNGGDDHFILSGWNMLGYGGAGNDVFEFRDLVQANGGAGADYYIFNEADFAAPGSWVSTARWGYLRDYVDGEDKIAILNGSAGVTSFADLTFTQDGTSVEITFPNAAPYIEVQNALVADFDATDFIFGDGTGGGGSSGVPYPTTTNTVYATSESDSKLSRMIS